MSDHDDDVDRLLDRHLDALRDEAVPRDGPSPAAVDATLAMLRAAATSTATRKGWFQMTLFQRLTTATSLAAAACLVLLLLVTRGPLGASVAYADVVDRLAHAHSMAYTTSVAIPGVEGVPPMSIRTIVADGGRMRTEMLNGVVTIRDGAAMVSLDAKAKTMTKIEAVGAPMPSRPASAPMPGDLVAGMKQLGGGVAEPLGDRTIDGVLATGFRTPWQSNGTLTIWADKKTAEPIRLEMTMSAGGVPTTAVLDHFEIDPPIDDATFSTALPAGYTLVTQKIDLTNATAGRAAEAVAAVLKSYTAGSGGTFPANLTDWVALMTFDAKGGPSVDPQLIGAMSGQLFSITGGYRYTGEGVKLGETDKIVFRYHPAGAKLDRAIFGDLRIADVDPAPTTQPK